MSYQLILRLGVKRRSAHRYRAVAKLPDTPDPGDGAGRERALVLLHARNRSDKAIKEARESSSEGPDRKCSPVPIAELIKCRVLTHEIWRVSLPKWGSRNHGFFGLYTETGILQLMLEIDEDRRIKHLVITDDMDAAHQQCRISHLE